MVLPNHNSLDSSRKQRAGVSSYLGGIRKQSSMISKAKGLSRNLQTSPSLL